MLKMKKYLVLIVILAVAWPTLFGNSGAQATTAIPQETDTLYGWPCSGVNYLNGHKEDLVNKKMVNLYSLLEQKGMEIRDVWTIQTSPWTDPCKKGRSYIRKLCIYSKPLEELEKNEKYFSIVVTLDLNENDTTIIYPDFWHSMNPEQSEIDQFVERTGNLPIRELEISIKTAIGH